jgi:hypothetical protein
MNDSLCLSGVARLPFLSANSCVAQAGEHFGLEWLRTRMEQEDEEEKKKKQERDEQIEL